MCDFIEPERLKVLADNHYKSHKAIAKILRKKKQLPPDHLIQQWDSELFSHIDCLECGNCCRNLGPRLTDRDISRLAKHLKIKEQKLIEKYLRKDEDNDYVFQSMPCPFLMEDNYCIVYEHRPKACRDYPQTDQPRFRNRMNLSLKNTFTCPVVYHIFRRLIKYYSK